MGFGPSTGGCRSSGTISSRSAFGSLPHGEYLKNLEIELFTEARRARVITSSNRHYLFNLDITEIGRTNHHVLEKTKRHMNGINGSTETVGREWVRALALGPGRGRLGFGPGLGLNLDWGRFALGRVVFTGRSRPLGPVLGLAGEQFLGC